MINLTDCYIDNLRHILPDCISNEAFNQARACFMDYLACSLAGRKYYGCKIDGYIHGIKELGQSSLIGVTGIKTSIQNAALINGISAHAIELDDGHRFGMLHLGAPVISALLSVAEKEKLSSDDFLYGIVIGYETAIRLACCVQPGCKLKGYHATGTCGTVGAAMGIAAAMHFSAHQTKSAISAAITSAAGVLEMIDGDTEMKPYNVGRAAMDGVTAAYIGKANFKTPEDALGGKRGFLRIMTDEPEIKYLTEFDDNKLMIETIYMKPYAACRHCHPSIEAALSIRKMNGFIVDEVESIHVDTYKLAVAGHDHVEICGTNSAKMSIPYSVAVALFTGNAGLEEFADDYIADERIINIAKKVSVADTDDLTSLCPQKRAAIVTVSTNSGVFIQRVDYPKGEPENPLTHEDLGAKFRRLAIYGGLTESDCDEVIKEIWQQEIDLARVLKIVCL